MASLSLSTLILLLLLLRALSHSLSPHLLHFDADRRNAVSDAPRRARNRGSELEGFHRWPLVSQHVVGLAFALWIASPSELHYSDAWTAVALVLMAAGFYLVGFVMLMMRLMQRYAELEAAEGQLRRPLADIEGDVGRRGGRGRRALYATLAVVYFILFTVAIARISWLLACPDR